MGKYLQKVKNVWHSAQNLLGFKSGANLPPPAKEVVWAFNKRGTADWEENEEQDWRMQELATG